MHVIETRDLVKRFDGTAVVEGLSLVVEEAAIFGLVGPNGAGKTTTLNMLTGLLEPTSGNLRLFGKDYKTDAKEIVSQTGVMREDLCLYEQLSGEEYLYFIARAFGLAKETIRSRIAELMDFMDLQDSRRRQIHQYSTGMKKKLALASTFIHEPRVLVLDEPFEGIDPLSLVSIRNALLAMQDRGITIVLTSHILERVENLCSHVGIIDHGKLCFAGPIDAVHAEVSQHTDGENSSDLESLMLRITGSESKSHLSWLEPDQL